MSEVEKPKAELVEQKRWEPSDKERRAIDGYYEKRENKAPAPRVKVKQNGNAIHINIDHPEPSYGLILLTQAIGSSDSYFTHELLAQLTNACSEGGKPQEGALNFMLAFIKGIEPRDQVEATLAAQMAAVQMAVMTASRRLANAGDIARQDSASNVFNKLARTFAAQVEALKRYRSKGEQIIRIERVYVGDGGQAIVGNVTHPGGGVTSKISEQPHERQAALPVSNVTALHSPLQAVKATVP